MALMSTPSNKNNLKNTSNLFIGGIKNDFVEKLKPIDDSKNLILKDLEDCLSWFPLTPHFNKYKIQSKKINNKNLFYKLKNIKLNKSLLNILLKKYYSRFVFPKISRTYTNLVIDKFISAQPISSPVGLIFYQDYQKNNMISSIGNLTLSGSLYCDTKIDL